MLSRIEDIHVYITLDILTDVIYSLFITVRILGMPRKSFLNASDPTLLEFLIYHYFFPFKIWLRVSYSLCNVQ